MSCTLSGTFLNPDGTLVANGTLILTLSQSAVQTGTGQVVPQRVSITLNGSGAIPAATTIIGNDSLTPSGTVYNAQIQTSAFVYYQLGFYSITGSTFNFNTATPSAGGVTYPFAVVQNPTSPQTITGQSLTLTGSAPLIAQGGITAGSINAILYVDGVQYTTIAAAIAALPASGGIVLIPPGTYVGPTSVPNGVALIGMGASWGEPSSLNRVFLTYTASLTLTNAFNTRWENLFLDFSTAPANAGLILKASGTGSNTFCSQNSFRNIVINQAGGSSLAALTLSAVAGSGGTIISNSFNNFENVIIFGNSQTSGNAGPALVGIQLIGSGTANAGPTVTQNHFKNIWIRGGLTGGVDCETNTDTNYFYQVEVQQEWLSTPSNSYVLAFNLNTPASDVDADGLFFSGLSSTGNFTNFMRAGQTTGSVIDFTGATGSANTVHVTGGTPQFCGRIIALNGGASIYYNCLGGTYSFIATPTTKIKNGSGGGNYTTTSTSYAAVDATNLTLTITIPLGYVLICRATGNIQSNTAAVVVNTALILDPASTNQVLAEAATAGSAGFPCTFALDTVITGDGNSHVIQLFFKTTNVADAASINNTSTTSSPKMTFFLTPSL